MTISPRTRRTVLSALIALPISAGTMFAQAAQQPVAKHHSKLKGAIVGAAAGHMMGGHAKAGAVAGAMVQHHRNHARKP